MSAYIKALVLGVREAFRGRITEHLSSAVSNGFARGVPILESSKCLGCGLCSRVCPPRAIKMRPAGRKVVGGREVPREEPSFDYFRCIYCGQCADVCPAKAITMDRRSPVDVVNITAPQVLILGAAPQVTSFLVIAAVVALVYWLSGKLAPRGRHGSSARKPFSGGVPLSSSRYRYYAVNLMAFVLFLLLAEALCFLYLLASPNAQAFAVLLLAALVIYLQGLWVSRRWAG
ncbi:MAG: 4Fe-4S binding protein [Thermofilum sp.]